MADDVTIRIGAKDNASRVLKNVGSQAGKLANRTQEMSTKASGSFGRMTKSIVGVTAAFFTMRAAAEGIKSVLSIASASEEIGSKFEVVFGDSAKSVKAWSDQTAKSMGVARGEMASMLASMQDILVPMGVLPKTAEKNSKIFAKLAVDLGSFNDLPTERVFRDLQAAVTGSGEVMKKYGVVLQEAGTKQELLNMGLDPKNTTNAEKAQARLNIILRSTTAAQGDAIRTAGGFANQLKRVQGNIKNIASTVGTSFMKPFADVMKTLNKRLITLEPTLKQVGEIFAVLAKTAIAASGAVISMVSAFSSLGVPLLLSSSRAKVFVGTFVSVVAIGPIVVRTIVGIVKGIQGLAKSLVVFQSLSGAKGIALLSAGLVAATAATIALDSQFKKTNQSIMAAASSTKALANAEQTAVEFTERLTASIYGQGAALDKTRGKLSRYNEELLKQSRLASLQNRLDAIRKKESTAVFDMKPAFSIGGLLDLFNSTVGLAKNHVKKMAEQAGAMQKQAAIILDPLQATEGRLLTGGGSDAFSRSLDMKLKQSKDALKKIGPVVGQIQQMFADMFKQQTIPMPKPPKIAGNIPFPKHNRERIEKQAETERSREPQRPLDLGIKPILNKAREQQMKAAKDLLATQPEQPTAPKTYESPLMRRYEAQAKAIKAFNEKKAAQRERAMQFAQKNKVVPAWQQRERANQERFERRSLQKESLARRKRGEPQDTFTTPPVMPPSGPRFSPLPSGEVANQKRLEEKLDTIAKAQENMAAAQHEVAAAMREKGDTLTVKQVGRS